VAANDESKLVLDYAARPYHPPTDTPDAVADAMLERGASLLELSLHFGAADRAIEHARDWATRRHPVRLPVGGEKCSHCHQPASTSVVCARLVASMEAGPRGELHYELPPFAVGFPLCDACARWHRLRVRASNHWHRPGVLIALMWTGTALGLALMALFYEDPHQRFFVFMTLGTFATLAAAMGVGWLWMLKSHSIPAEPRRMLLWLFALHSIDVIDLADGRDAGVRPVD
jgi:hypothetical protein